MYNKIIRPLLFKISPEKIHHIIVDLLKFGHYIPGCRPILRSMFAIKDKNLEREVFGIKFPNPVGLAAGFDKNAEVYEELNAMGFGFVEVGTVTPKAQPGNPKPRLFRLPKDSALINRMGFNNKGVESMAKNLRKKKCHMVIGGNLGKNTTTPNEKAPADYLKDFRLLYDSVDYFVVNISCPNITNLRKLQDKDNIKDILTGLTEFRRGQSNYRPILLKISPDLTFEQIDDTIEVIKKCGIDGIVATNTTTSRAGLITDSDTVANLGNGGLSGKPLTERSIEIVRYISQKTGGTFPIIGVGGIMSEDDAVAMLEAGASLIQVYTGFIYNGPKFVRDICKRLCLESQIKQGSY
ncbi:MAG: quinone-dependent dihydroorotate dehydrogenase [Rikenellaceae bacterium]|nr:quinone-dependent dihydroorotate dehydrogenase [Rikenellaceae bacterium]